MSVADAQTGPPARRLLLTCVRPHRRALFTGAVLSPVTGATGLLLPLVAGELIDSLEHGRAIAGALLAMSGPVVSNAALDAPDSYVLRRTAESVALGARRPLSSHLLRLRIAAVDRTEPGDLTTRITAGTTAARGDHRLPGRPGHGGGSPSRGPCCAGPGCCCSTRPPRSRTR